MSERNEHNDGNTQTAYFAGGCFWGLERYFQNVDGVTDTTVGYAQSTVESPTYEQVCAGGTDAAETVKVEFNPAQVSLRQLLEIFFATHDPTQLNRQGNDVGTQYRGGIYFTTPAQKDVADDLIREMSQDKLFGAPIVTEVEPLAHYFPAEDYHQDFFERNPHQGYCLAVAAPKVAKFRKTFGKWAKA